jgi:hypothetical protein
MAADRTTADIRKRDTRNTRDKPKSVAMAKSDNQALPTAVGQTTTRTGRPIKRIGALLVLSAVILSSVFRPDWLQSVQLPTTITHCFHSQSIGNRVSRILTHTPLIGMYKCDQLCVVGY